MIAGESLRATWASLALTPKRVGEAANGSGPSDQDRILISFEARLLTSPVFHCMRAHCRVTLEMAAEAIDVGSLLVHPPSSYSAVA
jgi:hypothetical protein